MNEKQARLWFDLKQAEEKIVEDRRKLEDEIMSGKDISTPRTITEDIEGFKVKILTKLSKTIDSEKLQSIASDNGLVDQLPILFRWKPDINKTVWDNADESIKNIFADAITAKPARPYFTIEEKKK
jgi:ribonuclease HII